MAGQHRPFRTGEDRNDILVDNAATTYQQHRLLRAGEDRNTFLLREPVELSNRQHQ